MGELSVKKKEEMSIRTTACSPEKPAAFAGVYSQDPPICEYICKKNN